MSACRRLFSLSLLFAAFALAFVGVLPDTVSAECTPPPASAEKCTSSSKKSGTSSAGGGGESLLLDWEVWWYQEYGYTSSQIKYNMAYSNRTSGTGAFELEVHGALVQDWGDQNITRYVFGPVYDQSIGMALGGQTDSWHNISGDTWYVASGHYYDHYDDNIIDAECPGCIDQIHN
jgi:hypothetical protein